MKGSGGDGDVIQDGVCRAIDDGDPVVCGTTAAVDCDVDLVRLRIDGDEGRAEAVKRDGLVHRVGPTVDDGHGVRRFVGAGSAADVRHVDLVRLRVDGHAEWA
jgi:hypothetical protein